jgi:antitoxin component of RelBE/YafQ-DinJ toxin-antitoxin module
MERFSLYNVMTTANREKLINIKIAEEVRHKIHVVAELRGLKMSQVIHSYIIQAIREEEAKNPALFDELLKKRIATATDSDEAEEEIRPTLAEIDAELAELERYLRNQGPTSQSSHGGGKLKVAKPQVETLIQARLKERRNALLAQREENRRKK